MKSPRWSPPEWDTWHSTWCKTDGIMNVWDVPSSLPHTVQITDIHRRPCFYSSENTLWPLSREMHQRLFKGSFNGSAWNKTVIPRKNVTTIRNTTENSEIPFFTSQVDGELLCWGTFRIPYFGGWDQWNFQRELAKSYQLYFRYILLGPAIPISGIYPKKGLNTCTRKLLVSKNW